MSNAVKGSRPFVPAGKQGKERFTICRLEVHSDKSLKPMIFSTTSGWTTRNINAENLNRVLHEERSDLFIRSNGIPIGVVANLKKCSWPGDRYMTFAAYILSLGCWPVSLEGRLSGDISVHSAASSGGELARNSLLYGYKGNVSVFSPIGLIPSVNGFPGFKGEVAAGPWLVPDENKTCNVFLAEIARAVAEVMTPEVQQRLSASQGLLLNVDDLKVGMTLDEVRAVFSGKLPWEDEVQFMLSLGTVAGEEGKYAIDFKPGMIGGEIEIEFMNARLLRWKITKHDPVGGVQTIYTPAGVARRRL